MFIATETEGARHGFYYGKPTEVDHLEKTGNGPVSGSRAARHPFSSTTAKTLLAYDQERVSRKTLALMLHPYMSNLSSNKRPFQTSCTPFLSSDSD